LELRLGEPMFGDKKKDPGLEALEYAQAQIKAIFKKMTHNVPILLFTIPGENEPFCQGAREVIRAFRELTTKITLREFDMGHKEAVKWNAEYSPTMLFDPKHFNIRWYGAPMGEEARTFVELLIMIGYGKSNIGVEAKKILDKIESPRNIKVFVSPT
jgi:thioredoxin reductase (NADPH)